MRCEIKRSPSHSILAVDKADEPMNLLSGARR